MLYETAKELKQYLFEENTEAFLSQYTQYIAILHDLVTLCQALSIPDNRIAEEFSHIRAEKQPCCKAEADLMQRRILALLDRILYQSILRRGSYCMIRRSDPVPGLASHMITNLGQIISCFNEGRIPVVDMQYAPNLFTPLSKEYGQNAWELFFRQPVGGVTVETAASVPDTTMKDGIPGFMPNYSMDCLTNPALMQFWQTAMHSFMPFSNHMKQKADAALQTLPFSGSRILGVLCRGTDYTSLRPYNHPVQPDPYDVLQQAQDVMKQYHCDYCYLATEDEDILSTFRAKLGSSLLTTQETYYTSSCTQLLSGMFSGQAQALYQKNTEYLTSLFVLSRCHCLLAGRTSGSLAALLLNRQPYEYCHIYNLGRYGIDDALTLQHFVSCDTLEETKS